MNQTLKAWAIAAAISFGPSILVIGETPVPRFLVRTELDLVAGLPSPPAAGSLAAAADLEAVLQAQAWRTPESVAWAKAVDEGKVWDNAEVLGSWFKEGQLPQLARFFRGIGKEFRPVCLAAKKSFDRPRPFMIDGRIQPCLPLPTDTSFPSGHASYFFMEAEVLAEIFPEARKALLEHAHKAAWGRILAGVHFPTDTVAGRLLAQAFVGEIKKSRAFQKGIEACRAEAAPFRLKKAG